MRAPDGSDMWGKFIYREIVAPERLVFIVSFTDKDGGVTRHPWSPNWPLQTLSTVMFEEHGEKLVLTEQDVFLDGIDSVAAREQGTRDLLDNLDKYVSQP
jgi:uncharacterized protein YndB with AHSA1/START domain